MTSQQILQSDVLDILFENRNKTYGAYDLRKTYNMRLWKALGGTLLSVLALLFFGNTSSTKDTIEKPDTEYIVREVKVPEEKKPEPPKERLQAQPPQQTKTDVYENKIKVVEQTIETIATQDQLRDAAFGDKKIEGPSITTMQQPPLPPSTGNGNVQEEKTKEEPPLPNRQPQFPGGVDAWRNFLSRYLQAPQDLEAGEKRTVIVRFWVDEEGAVTNFQVMQSAGSAFDNEVIRVLKKMPKWLPAIQNGRPVAISFTQPVTFTSVEE